MPAPSLLRRLEERKLVQWALAYLAGAFVISQLIELMAEPWAISAVVQRAMHLALVVGFCVTLVLAWYHGEKGRQRASGPELLMVAALLVMAGVALSTVTGSAGPDPSRLARERGHKPSVAVLPCANISPNPEDAFYADGLHEEILVNLQEISSLISIGRTSVLQYAEAPPTVEEISSILGVGFVGECTVRKDPHRDRIRVTFQLLDSTGVQLWADNYDRDLTVAALFDIESDVAQRVTRAMRAVITTDEVSRIEERPTDDLLAYEHYRRGRHFWNQRSLVTLDSAIRHFNKAVLLDPGFARAYAALAETFAIVPDYGGAPIPDILPFARAATERALALDPELGEAWVASGYIKAVFEWKREEGLEDLERAIALNPDYATAHQWHAEVLAVSRRLEEALLEARRAVELDPLSLAPNLVLGVVLVSAGELEEAVPVLERAVGIVPNAKALHWLGAVHALLGDYEGAERFFEQLVDLTGDDLEPLRAYLSALSDPAQVPAAVEALRTMSIHGVTNSLIDPAGYLAHLGCFREALEALEEAYEARHPMLPWVNVEPHFEGMRSDPEFRDLLRRMNFPVD